MGINRNTVKRIKQGLGLLVCGSDSRLSPFSWRSLLSSQPKDFLVEEKDTKPNQRYFYSSLGLEVHDASTSRTFGDETLSMRLDCKGGANERGGE
jgi:hypothetical protein